MTAFLAIILAASEPAAEAAAESGGGIEDLIPHLTELAVGFIAFFILFAFMAKWVMPKLNTVLEERREKIQGEMEKAEATRKDAEAELAEYKQQMASARDEANRIIEEARKTAEDLRKDLQARAEQESQNLVVRAQDEIRAERDRVFQELKASVGQLSVDLAGRVVGESLDPSRHQKLVDDYIDQVAGLGNGDGK